MALAERGAGEGGRDERRFLHADAEFLAKLAHQRLLRPLAGLDLAAGEFPQPRHGLSRKPLLEEHAPVRSGQSGGHHQECRFFFHLNARC